MSIPQIVDVLVQADIAGESLSQRSVVRRLTLVFDQPVTLDTAGVGVTGAGGPVASLDLLTSDGVAFVFRFGPDAQVEHGSLVDGNYTVAVVAGAAVNSSAESNTAYATEIYRLFADSNGDRTVDEVDKTAFGNAFGSKYLDPAFQSYFDFNDDGHVNNTDLAAFAARFGTVLNP